MVEVVVVYVGVREGLGEGGHLWRRYLDGPWALCWLLRLLAVMDEGVGCAVGRVCGSTGQEVYPRPPFAGQAFEKCCCPRIPQTKVTW